MKFAVCIKISGYRSKKLKHDIILQVNCQKNEVSIYLVQMFVFFFFCFFFVLVFVVVVAVVCVFCHIFLRS